LQQDRAAGCDFTLPLTHNAISYDELHLTCSSIGSLPLFSVKALSPDFKIPRGECLLEASQKSASKSKQLFSTF